MLTFHNHQHTTCCTHENVKYCGVCRVVYCVNCNTEWRNNGWYWYYPNFTYTLGNTLGNSLSNTLDNAAGSNKAVPYDPTDTAGHVHE